MDQDHTQRYLEKPHTITWKLAGATTIISLSTLQFGYHLSELNGPSTIIPCKDTQPSHGWNGCIAMSTHSIATITTMYTVGGFLVSILLGFTKISSWYGRKVICSASALGYSLGSLVMCCSFSSTGLNVGRFITGFSAGAALIMSPLLVNELTPINHRGLLGSLLQFAIAVGIFLGQAVSLVWGDNWRYVFVFASALGFVQFVLLFFVTESPKWIVMNVGNISHATTILDGFRSDKETVFHEINHWRRLSSSSNTSRERPLLETAPLLKPKVSRRGSFDESDVSVWEFVVGGYRHQAGAVFILMTSQQLVGINAIVFYGVSILSSLFSSNSLIIACSISLVNVLSAFGAAHIVDKVGRRPLMMVSCAISGLCAMAIGVGLIYKIPFVIVGACYGFVIGYSVGIGPIPYLMVSELSSHEVISLAQSIGTSANWGANMLIAYFVPILQHQFGGGTFLIFAFACFIYLFAVYRWVPETRGISNGEEAWN